MIFPFLITTFAMSDFSLAFYTHNTRIAKIYDKSKRFEKFICQTLGLLARFHAAEFRCYK